MLRPVVDTRFQVLFHSPSGVLFTFPSRYFFTIGHQLVFSLGRWSSLLPTRFHVSRGTLEQICLSFSFTYRAVTFYGGAFQLSSVKKLQYFRSVRNPRNKFLVWALSLSLAATKEIDFSFFSSGYLDVSVHRVCDTHLLIQCVLIRVSRDQRSFDNYPGLIAVFHALHRLLTPRHPPCALSSLAT